MHPDAEHIKKLILLIEKAEVIMLLMPNDKKLALAADIQERIVLALKCWKDSVS